ncbi:MAG: acetyl-CoA hydrolase/transferase C-terminal domain-containing protein [Sterolibacterium sp.]
MSNWREDYERRFISAEAAAAMVNSGDRVAFTSGREAFSIGLALASRIGELSDVHVLLPSPSFDFGWYDEGWQEAFDIIIRAPTSTCQEAVDARRVDVDPGTMIPFLDIAGATAADVVFTEVSAPDENGYCSFGSSLWAKKRQIENAKLSIAEVNKNLIRTYGENYIHVSEIDYFVEHVSTGKGMRTGSLAGRELKEPEPWLKDIAGYVGQLIKDGDTLQIGVGRTTEPLVGLGMLDGRQDIGWHSEATPPGIISLIRKGVINGSRKTLHPGKAVVTSIGGSSQEEMAWVNNNPQVMLVDVAYLEDLRVIGQHDNFVAINNALMIDLTGQLCCETLGFRQMATAGGQIAFVFGSWLSKGGRSITVLPSTAKNGAVSRIVPTLPEGSVITIQRNCVDYVVTEFGIAHLKGKTRRQRSEALIAVAHPDFRDELTAKAREFYWP